MTSPHTMGGGLSRKRKGEYQESSKGKVLNKQLTQCAGGFACLCSICTDQIKKERRAQVALTIGSDDQLDGINEVVFEGIPRDFEWLMRSLLP